MTPATLEELLSAIESRSNAATEGPWKYQGRDYVGFLGECFFSVIGGLPDEDGALTIVAPERIRFENADFIAHSRTDIPRLLAALRLAISQRDYYRKFVKETGPSEEYIINKLNEKLISILTGEGDK